MYDNLGTLRGMPFFIRSNLHCKDQKIQLKSALHIGLMGLCQVRWTESNGVELIPAELHLGGYDGNPAQLDIVRKVPLHSHPLLLESSICAL